MHGHDFNRIVAGIHIRQCKEIGEAFLESVMSGEIARLLLASQFVEKNFGVFKFGGVTAAGGPAECEPRALDTIAQIAAQAMRKSCGKHGTYALQPAARIVIQQRNAGRIVHRFPHRVARAFDKRRKLCRRQSTPRRAQQREPRRAIGRMHQCARQCVKILHYLLFAQPLNFDRAIAYAGLLQSRHDVIEMTAVAHEYRNGSLRVRGACRPRDVDHALRFVRALAEEMPLHRLAFRRRMVRDRGRIGHCA